MEHVGHCHLLDDEGSVMEAVEMLLGDILIAKETRMSFLRILEHRGDSSTREISGEIDEQAS
jgi:hypothetical protein